MRHAHPSVFLNNIRYGGSPDQVQFLDAAAFRGVRQGGNGGGGHALVPIHLWKAGGASDPAGIWAEWYTVYVSVLVPHRAQPSMSMQTQSLGCPVLTCVPSLTPDLDGGRVPGYYFLHLSAPLII